MDKVINFKTERETYLKKMKQLKPKLPKDWAKQAVSKVNVTSIETYQKLYSDLINMVNGRSYKLYSERQDLYKIILSTIKRKR